MADQSKLKEENGSPGGKRSLGSGLFLTLPNNFSPVSSLSPGSSGGSATPPGSKGISRGSPSHNYSWEDLRRLFLVSLEKMYMMEPESLPFRQPVNIEELGIPDYVDIIRKPMDLQTIRSKMSSGKYTDPWGYVDDVLRMLDNAWVYNRQGSKVCQYCSKLADVFQREVNPVLNHLGFREGRTNSYQFNSETVTCHGRPVCLVENGKGFYRDTSRNIEYNLCETCYQDKHVASPSTCSISPSVTPDVIPSKGCGDSDSPSSSPRGSVTLSSSSFEYIINSSRGSYSPAAELHKSHMRDAEMSRQLVLREFLRMLLASDTTGESKANVFKMLSVNAKLMTEFVEYVKRRRNIVGGNEGCSVVIGESFTTLDLDGLLQKLRAITVNNGVKCDSISVASSDKENE